MEVADFIGYFAVSTGILYCFNNEYDATTVIQMNTGKLIELLYFFLNQY